MGLSLGLGIGLSFGQGGGGTLTYSAIGDSHTYRATEGSYERFYTALMAARLGSQWLPRNKGVSGNASTQVRSRIANDILKPDVPIALNIYVGTNDALRNTTVSASPSPTARNMTLGLTTGYVAGGWITVAGELAQIQSISGSRITLTAALTAGVPAAGAPVQIATQKNIEDAGQIAQAAGVQRITVMGQHYLNFASGGDTPSTQPATLIALRGAQQAAAATLGVPYVDTYAYMRQLIIDGVYAQGDDLAWHIAVGDTHLNDTGQIILRDALYATWVAQGWAA